MYFLARNKKFYCLETGTGEVRWVSEEKFGEYWSLVANGNRILALDQSGELLLIEADREALRILDRRKVSKESTWAHLAVEGDRVLVRGLESLSAYVWR